MASAGRGARNKGGAFELKIAKALSIFWGHTFQRTPGSGSLHWSAENNVAGDIVAGPSSGFPYVVECKKHEGNWTLENVMLNNLDIKNWWGQVISDSKRVKRTPMLIFTRNRAKEFIMIPYDEEMYQTLVLSKHEVLRTVVTVKDELTLKEESFDVMVMLYDGLTSFTPGYLIDKHTNYDWEKKNLIKFPNEAIEETDSMEDILGKIKKL